MTPVCQRKLSRKKFCLSLHRKLWPRAFGWRFRCSPSWLCRRPNINEQETEHVFKRFEETIAFEIGSSISANGLVERQALVVDVRLWDRQLFHAALPGSSAITAEWARRKVNSVRIFHKSSYRLALEQQRGDRTFPPGYGLSPTDYALAGGAFPIRILAVGVIGAIVVSGLSERADHETAVAALCTYLGMEKNLLALDQR